MRHGCPGRERLRLRVAVRLLPLLLGVPEALQMGETATREPVSEELGVTDGLVTVGDRLQLRLPVGEPVRLPEGGIRPPRGAKKQWRAGAWPLA